MNRVPLAPPSENGAESRVAILLPTWNSERHLEQQIDSLLNQTYRNWIVITRDDGSADASRSLIARYARAYPQAFHIVADDDMHLGASGSFARLMGYALANKDSLGLHPAYLMLSDHDDIWYPHKTAVSMQRMRALERRNPGLPLLVHSDLQVVDRQGSRLAPSFAAYQAVEPSRNGFARMLVSNTVTGCSILMNEQLATLALPIPVESIMHDWWLALVASAFGKIAYVEEALLDYRQHATNTLGARQYREPELANLFSRLLDHRYDCAFSATARQARAFGRAYAALLGVGHKLPLALARMMSLRVSPLSRLLFRILRR